MALLTRYEVARIVGLRALQLDAGAQSLVAVEDDVLRRDPLYVAALELAERKLDVLVRRGDVDVHVRDARFPTSLRLLLDTKDGRTRARTYAPPPQSLS
jgi:DNA-directed RNA polymerase subunit K/omega